VTTAPLLRPPPWTAFAACDGHPLGPHAWDNNTPAARAICATCPVRHHCALDALNHAIPDGMWGGLTPDDRATVAAGVGYDRPGLPPHGTRQRYTHRDQPCRDNCPSPITCREAHRRWAQERRAQGAWTRPDTTEARIPA
jgi:hypothetical protein